MATLLLKDEALEKQRHPFDLEERTAVFGVSIMRNELPRSKFQHPSRRHASAQAGARVALFEAWNFYGAWMVEFEALWPCHSILNNLA